MLLLHYFFLLFFFYFFDVDSIVIEMLKFQPLGVTSGVSKLHYYGVNAG